MDDDFQYQRDDLPFSPYPLTGQPLEKGVVLERFYYVMLPPMKEFVRRDLIARDVVVFAQILARAGQTDLCWTPMHELAETLGVSLKAVQRAIDRLEAERLLYREVNTKDQRKVQYRILLHPNALAQFDCVPLYVLHALELPIVLRHTLIALFKYLRIADVTSCYPGQETLASELGIQDRALRKRLTELERRRFIKIEDRPERPGCNRYLILAPRSRLLKPSLRDTRECESLDEWFN